MFALTKRGLKEESEILLELLLKSKPYSTDA